VFSPLVRGQLSYDSVVSTSSVSKSPEKTGVMADTTTLLGRLSLVTAAKNVAVAAESLQALAELSFGSFNRPMSETGSSWPVSTVSTPSATTTSTTVSRHDPVWRARRAMTNSELKSTFGCFVPVVAQNSSNSSGSVQ